MLDDGSVLAEVEPRALSERLLEKLVEQRLWRDETLGQVSDSE